MSLFIDRKFLGQISPKLKLFKIKANNVFTFRCPLCGDSQKKKTKTRGYIYRQKADLFFKCFNCNRNHSFYNFLKEVDPSLARTYSLERFAAGEIGTNNYPKPKIDFTTKKPAFLNKEDPFLNVAIKISDLPNDHFIRQYVKGRKIPSKFYEKLYYTKDFKTLVDKVVPENKLTLPNEARIIIPFYDQNGKLIAFQGRQYFGDTLRYITIKLKEENLKIFGLDRLDPEKPIFVLEGPFDSMFLDNAIAAAGSDLPTYINPKNCVFIFDNEPKNKEIVKKMEKIIKKGYQIYIWQERFKNVKDLNDLKFKLAVPVIEIIGAGICQGIDAEWKFAKWRKQ